MQAAAKTGRFDMSSMLSKIIQRFRAASSSIQTLAKDYKFNVGDIEDEKKMVAFLHDLFCDVISCFCLVVKSSIRSSKLDVFIKSTWISYKLF